MSTRPRKVGVVILGRGLAAAALADALAQRGQRVALLVEEPGWAQGIRPAWRGWHPGPRAALAEAGAATLAAWQAAALPGITAPAPGADGPWLLDLAQLLPALGERIAAAEGCWVAIGTRVRGISVIEGEILGAIAEDARYDARQLVNAAEDERFAAFARMMRQPHPLDLHPVAPTDGPPAVAPDGQVAWPGARPFARDAAPPTAAAATVRGGWSVRGVAGWPLLALALAEALAEQIP